MWRRYESLLYEQLMSLILALGLIRLTSVSFKIKYHNDKIRTIIFSWNSGVLWTRGPLYFFSPLFHLYTPLLRRRRLLSLLIMMMMMMMAMMNWWWWQMTSRDLMTSSTERRRQRIRITSREFSRESRPRMLCALMLLCRRTLISHVTCVTWLI